MVFMLNRNLDVFDFDSIYLINYYGCHVKSKLEWNVFDLVPFLSRLQITFNETETSRGPGANLDN